MHSAIKLIIGLIIFAAGIYWYLGPGIPGWIDNALSALHTVFIGVFGLFLIFLGFIVAWIEYEDLKWDLYLILNVRYAICKAVHYMQGLACALRSCELSAAR
ncbi:MAG: hypothetical protein NT129_03940 [Candidatus Aenigmarchaeota archaeon]|nr:hypothetical protein [Candidatus Aenigmarchaeota archaeon]